MIYFRFLIDLLVYSLSPFTSFFILYKIDKNTILEIGCFSIFISMLYQIWYIGIGIIVVYVIMNKLKIRYKYVIGYLVYGGYLAIFRNIKYGGYAIIILMGEVILEKVLKKLMSS